MRRSRSSRIVVTNESRVLRELRLKHRLTMRAVAAAIGCTDSFVSHVETGRVAVPQGERLAAFLEVYGGISGKYYRELVRDRENTVDELSIIQELLPKLNYDQLAMIRGLAEKFLSKQL